MVLVPKHITLALVSKHILPKFHLLQIRLPSNNERPHRVIFLHIYPMVIHPHILVAQLSRLRPSLGEQDLFPRRQMIVEENIGIFVTRDVRIDLLRREPFQIVRSDDFIVESSVVVVQVV